MATQPEKQPGDTARKTIWRQSQKNNLATQPKIQPGDTARKTTLTRPGGLAAHNGLEDTFIGNRR